MMEITITLNMQEMNKEEYYLHEEVASGEDSDGTPVSVDLTVPPKWWIVSYGGRRFRIELNSLLSQLFTHAKAAANDE